MSAARPPAEAAETQERPAPQRRRLLPLLLSVPFLLVAGTGLWWYAGTGSESTENAALHFGRISVAPSIGGRVVDVAIHDLQKVKAGDLLFRIDPAPYRIALTRAEAALSGARLQVEQMKAAYAEAQAQAALARSDAGFLASELARQQSLTGRGVDTRSKLDDARHADEQADARAAVAESALAAARAALGGDPDAATDTHPIVQVALAAVAAARYDLEGTEIRAAADGIVSQAANLRPGAMVSPGQPVFALVDAGDLWVEANFKETQLASVQPGQPVEVVLDIAPDHPFHGRVEAIGAGTGAEFSLLPAQNATGNWVKVTQRVPVRIALDDPAALAGYASGLSAEVTVDTGASPFAAFAKP
jgi:membrane fusion protein (multidrug efflux system)